jgi:microcystin-dependent protein
MRRCIPVGPGLSLHDLGETSGTETVTLRKRIPSHSHALMAAPTPALLFAPSSTTAQPVSGGPAYIASNAGLVQLSDNAIAPAGGDQPHNNMQPYLTLNFCIALQGVFPPRT